MMSAIVTEEKAKPNKKQNKTRMDSKSPKYPSKTWIAKELE